MSEHLWEIKHPYYCNEGNYYANEEVGREFGSWQEFIAEFGDADFDMNLVFRWDWEEIDQESREPTYRGDDYYRNGRLLIFWMGQRKGLYHYSVVSVCRADETEVIKFLRRRFEHMLKLWAPLSLTADSKGEST